MGGERGLRGKGLCCEEAWYVVALRVRRRRVIAFGGDRVLVTGCGAVLGFARTSLSLRSRPKARDALAAGST